MRAIQSSLSRGAFALALLGAATAAQATGVVGKLTTERSATVDSAGLEVRLRPQQDYIIFSGDRIETGAEGWSVLDIPGTGKVAIAPDSLVRVELIDGSYQLRVERGQTTYDVDPDSGFEVIAGEQVVTLSRDSVAGSTVVVPDSGQAFRAERDHQGDLRVSDLNSGELLYQGPAEQSSIPLYAQVGAPPGGDGGVAAWWNFLPPVAFLSIAGAAGLTDDGDEPLLGEEPPDDDDPPSSPVSN